MAKSGQISKGALFLILLVTFLAIELMGARLVQSHLQNSYRAEKLTQLESIAQIAANQINGDHHDLLYLPNDKESQTFLEQKESLSKVLSAFPHVSQLTTLRTTEDTSTPVITVRHNTSESQIRSGIVSAFAPITDSEGSVVALLRADYPTSHVEMSSSMFSELQVVLIGGFVFALGLSWVLASFLGSSKSQAVKVKGAPGKKRMCAEVFLFLAIAFLVIEGGHLIIKQNVLQSKRALTSQKLDFLFDLKGSVASGHHQNLDDKLLARADGLGYTSLVSGLLHTPSADDATTALSLAESRLLTDTFELDQQFDENRQSQQNVVLIAALITAVSLITIRYASAKDFQIIQTQQDSLAVQRQYQNVVENLPIGLFIYKDGDCTFCNREWARQLPQDAECHCFDSLMQVVHTDDRDRVLAAIHMGEKFSRPFAVQYRVITEKGTRYMETRGVPIHAENNTLDHILGFSVDITPTVSAKLALQQAYNDVEKKNTQLGDALSELEDSLASMVRSFVKAVEAKDPYTAGHSERVMQYSVWLGQAIGLGPYEKRILELGALVHDVGKIGIPDAILTKPDRLTNEEFDVIKMHPVWGAQIIEQIGMFKECVPIVRSHHERLDGRGYPDGMKGEEIPLLVRIVAIADIFDAMTSTRAYRKGMELETVLSHMQEIAEKGEIDLELFTSFKDVINDRGIIPQIDSQNDAEDAA